MPNASRLISVNHTQSVACKAYAVDASMLDNVEQLIVLQDGDWSPTLLNVWLCLSRLLISRRHELDPQIVLPANLAGRLDKRRLDVIPFNISDLMQRFYFNEMFLSAVCCGIRNSLESTGAPVTCDVALIGMELGCLILGKESLVDLASSEIENSFVLT
jgi:hypothetical protein